MPNLQRFVADPDLYPRQTGAPRGVVGLRVPQAGGLDPRAGGAIGAAVADLGQSTQQLGLDLRRQEEQRAELAARKKRALDALNAADSANQAVEALDTFERESAQDANYQEHPGRVRTRADELEAQYKEALQGLGPEAQLRFKVQFGEHRAVVNRQAEHYVTTRSGQHVKSVLDEASDQFVRSQLDETDPVKQAYGAIRYQSTLDSFVEEGVLFPEQRNQALTKAMDGVATKQAELLTHTEAASGLAVQHFGALAEGRPGIPDMPVPPPTELHRLLGLAENARTQYVNQVFATDQRAAKVVGQSRELNEVTLLPQIREAQSLEHLDLLQRRVYTLGQDPGTSGLERAGYDRLLDAVDAKRKELTEPRTRSVQMVLDAYNLTVTTQRGERTKAQALELIGRIYRDGRLAEADKNRLAQDLEGEVSAAHFSKLAGYGPAMRTIDTALAVYDTDERKDPAAAQSMVFAVRQFEQGLQHVIDTEGLNAAERALPGLADQAILDFTTTIMGEMRQRLAAKPPVPEALQYRTQPNPDALTKEDIDARYMEGVYKLRQWRQLGGPDGTPISEMDLYMWLRQLDARKEWEEKYLSALERTGRHPTPQTGPAPSGRRQEQQRRLQQTPLGGR